MACKCIEKTNEQLLRFNTQLSLPVLVFGDDLTKDSVIIATEKADPKSRTSPKRVFASYCPFCGTAYKEVIKKATA